MALADIALLDPDEFTAYVTAHSAKVKAELQQLITRSNTLKDLAESVETTANAAAADIVTLQADMTTAQGDIDAVEAAVAAFEGNRMPHDVLAVTSSIDMDLATVGDYSVLEVTGAAVPTIALGASTGLDRRLFYIFCNTTSGCNVTWGSYTIPMRNGDSLMVMGYQGGWVMLAYNRGEIVPDQELASLESTDSRVLTWQSPRIQRLSYDSAGGGTAELLLPEIDAYHLGQEFTISWGYNSGKNSGGVLRVQGSNGYLSPGNQMFSIEDPTAAIGASFSMTTAGIAIFRAAAGVNVNGTTTYVWAVVS